MFMLEAPDLGEMRRVLIGHDNSGFGPGWKLEDVTVEDLNAAMDAPDAHKKQHFAGDVWLDKSKAPYQTQAELLPSDGVQRAKAKKVKYTARLAHSHSLVHSRSTSEKKTFTWYIDAVYTVGQTLVVYQYTM